MTKNLKPQPPSPSKPLTLRPPSSKTIKSTFTLKSNNSIKKISPKSKFYINRQKSPRTGVYQTKPQQNQSGLLSRKVVVGGIHQISAWSQSQEHQTSRQSKPSRPERQIEKRHQRKRTLLHNKRKNMEIRSSSLWRWPWHMSGYLLSRFEFVDQKNLNFTMRHD